MWFRCTVTPCLLFAALSVGVTTAHAETCRNTVDGIVKTETTELLQTVVENDPALAEMGEETLVLEGGKKLLEAPRPDFKARGWMMLLWYGGKTGQDIVAQSAETLETEEDRAHLYLVMGMYQLRAKTAETASGGRDLLAQVKDTGKISFLPDEMWTLFLETCELPG
jgi:hypothetical protein